MWTSLLAIWLLSACIMLAIFLRDEISGWLAQRQAVRGVSFGACVECGEERSDADDDRLCLSCRLFATAWSPWRNEL